MNLWDLSTSYLLFFLENLHQNYEKVEVVGVGGRILYTTHMLMRGLLNVWSLWGTLLPNDILPSIWSHYGFEPKQRLNEFHDRMGLKLKYAKMRL